MQLFVDQDYLNSAFQEYPKVPLHFLIFVHFWSRHCQKSLSALRRAPSSGEFLDVCYGWHRPDRISCDPDCHAVDWTISCPKPGHEKALRAVLRFILLHMKMSQNFPHLDLRTFLRRTSVWKCIVMLDLPLCKLCRGEALLVVIVFRSVVLSVFLDIRHL